MVEQFSTGGRGPLGVPTNSPVSDPGTSARIQNRPNVPLAAASLPLDHDGRPRPRIGGNREVRTVQLPQLQFGSRGQYVQRLQRLLNSRLDSDTDLKVDGICGPKTRAAVIEFQKESDLKPDGIVGRGTWFALISAEPQDATSKPKPAPARGPAASPPPGAPAAAGTPLPAGIPAPAGTPAPVAGPTGAAASVSEVFPVVPAPSTEKGVDEWSLKERFEYVINHTGPYLKADLRAQFVALLSAANIAIMVGFMLAAAAGSFFGVTELVGAFLLGFGIGLMGPAAIDAARAFKNFIELTVAASTKPELEDAASDLAQVITFVGVMGFFLLLHKVGDAIGEQLKAAKDTAAPPEEEAPPPKAKPEAESPKKAAEPKESTASPEEGDAKQIANGHAWGKHQGEFPGWKQAEFEAAIKKTMQAPDATRSLSRGRTAYWNAKENMVVIKDPASPDAGTAFRPTKGKAYFDGLK